MEELTDYQKRALGRALKAARLRLDWTQEKAGERGGLARAYIAHIERGSKVPSLAVFIGYCAAMGVNPSDILVESHLAAPAEQGIHPILLEGMRRLGPDTGSRLAASWPHFQRFVTSLLCANGAHPPGG